MTDSTLFRIELPNELQERLLDVGVDVLEELRNQGLDVKKTAAPELLGEAGAKGDAALIIAAVGASSVMIAHGVAKIIHALGNTRQYLVEERKVRAVTDPKGKAVRNADGTVKTYVAEEFRVIQPDSVPLPKMEADIANLIRVRES